MMYLETIYDENELDEYMKVEKQKSYDTAVYFLEDFVKIMRLNKVHFIDDPFYEARFDFMRELLNQSIHKKPNLQLI